MFVPGKGLAIDRRLCSARVYSRWRSSFVIHIGSGLSPAGAYHVATPCAQSLQPLSSSLTQHTLLQVWIFHWGQPAELLADIDLFEGGTLFERLVAG